MPLCNEIKSFWQDEIGHMSEMQAEFIIDRLKHNSIKRVLEIGFAGGRHTYTILKSFDIDKMVTIDIDFDYQDGRHKIKAIKEEFDNIIFIEGDSKKMITEDFMGDNFPDKIDYALIDGGHSYDDAFQDMSNVFKYIKDGGIMIVDDYKSKICPLVSVDMAVHDFSRINNIEFEPISLEDGKGMAVFAK
jgi:predicted O-methyltransferase YrrM